MPGGKAKRKNRPIGSPSSSSSSPEEKENTNKKFRLPTRGDNMGETASESDRIVTKMMELFEKQSSEMREMEQSIKESIDQKIGSLTARVEGMEEENLRLKNANEDLEKRMRRIEREARAKNIVFSGFKFESPQEGYQMMHKFVHETTEGKLKVSGLKTFQTHTAKKIVASCESLEDKRKIMSLKRNLREETDPNKTIYIDDDLTKADQMMQATLRKMAKELRSNGKEAKVEFGRIRINGELFYYNQEKQQLEQQRFRKNENSNMERPRPAEKGPGIGGLH